ncbi:hypothetical protein S40288_05802 [Stachybotrys chartarum IBT 40288]|nr:hypothetical protein S40288_05802 [Stachybotrys chartarum IBT 40288]
MTTISYIVTALSLVYHAGATPAITFPVNSQLPPVARIGELFSYSFSSTTFQSGSTITYTLGDHPSWLAIESSQRRLFGTPDESSVPPGDVVGQNVEIVASDDSGSITHNATLVVSRNRGPAVRIPAQEQIGELGPSSAPASLLSHPSTNFEYSFDRGTFDAPDGANYYAVSGNNSPLPSWIVFDATTLTFSGTTPPFETLVQPPQMFNFSLVASDIVGFSAVSTSFSIIVGSHVLTTEEPNLLLNATPGSAFHYDGFGRSIQLDDVHVAPGGVQVSTHGMPSWMSFDPNTWEIDGTPGKDDSSANFTITFRDPLSDTLEVFVTVAITSTLFKSSFPDLVFKPGEEVDLDLADFLKNPQDTEVDVEMKPPQDWLKQNGLKLTGDVPMQAPESFEISVEASSRSSDLTEAKVFPFQVLEADETREKTATTSSTSTIIPPAHTDSGTEADGGNPADAEGGGISKTTLLLATILPILSIAFLLMLLIFCLRRRRARKNRLYKKPRQKPATMMEGGVLSDGEVSVQHLEEHFIVNKGSKSKVRLFAPIRKKYSAFMPSRTSTRSFISDSSGHLDSPDLPPGFLMMDPDSSAGLGHTVNSGFQSDQESWTTTDGTGNGYGSRGSNALGLDTPQQLLPQPSFVTDSRETSLSEALDLTLPLIAELPSIQHTPVVAYQPYGRIAHRGSIDGLSTSTSSSGVLPMEDRRYSRRISRDYSFTTGSLSPAPTVEDDPTEEVAELRPLTRIRVPPLRQPSRQIENPSIYGLTSSTGNQSQAGRSSFGSSENWRTAHLPEPDEGNDASIIYRGIVEDAPFHPSRPNTSEGTQGNLPLSMPYSGEVEIHPLSLRTRRPPHGDPPRLVDAASLGSEEDEGRAKGSQGSFGAFLGIVI